MTAPDRRIIIPPCTSPDGNHDWQSREPYCARCAFGAAPRPEAELRAALETLLDGRENDEMVEVRASLLYTIRDRLPVSPADPPTGPDGKSTANDAKVSRPADPDMERLDTQKFPTIKTLFIELTGIWLISASYFAAWCLWILSVPPRVLLAVLRYVVQNH